MSLKINIWKWVEKSIDNENGYKFELDSNQIKI